MPRVAAHQRAELERTRRDQIVEAAIGLWLADGYDATSVAAIARASGLAKGTLYLYFETKADILDEAIRRYSMAPDLRGYLDALRGVPAADAIPRVVRGIWQALRARSDLVKLFVRELTVRPEHARHFYENVVLPGNEVLAEYFDSHDDFRDMNGAIAARALIGALIVFLFTQHIFGGDDIYPMSDDAIVTTVSELFLRGALRAA